MVLPLSTSIRVRRLLRNGRAAAQDAHPRSAGVNLAPFADLGEAFRGALEKGKSSLFERAGDNWRRTFVFARSLATAPSTVNRPVAEGDPNQESRETRKRGFFFFFFFIFSFAAPGIPAGGSAVPQQDRTSLSARAARANLEVMRTRPHAHARAKRAFILIQACGKAKGRPKACDSNGWDTTARITGRRIPDAGPKCTTCGLAVRQGAGEITRERCGWMVTDAARGRETRIGACISGRCRWAACLAA